ncbi:hypothetical protein RchiOBHm_Chr1g0334601 [Rosa chinensis]|uniref:Non-specific serine/threonine protein kinase n=1 Tax=Rosa chinensis TaxID=74649 RepID=A0A2P6SCD1_ROSCH|nr:hypothetical protein RchiOBHm_Chr1g0334601 [Rosa chinensis]
MVSLLLFFVFSSDFLQIGQGGFGVVYYSKLTSEDNTKIVTASGDQTVTVHFERS